MEFATENNESRTKLNTKGCCFMCLKTYDSKLINGVDEDRKSVFIGHLLRYFQMGKNVMAGTILSTTLKSSKLEVDLCKECEKIIARFSVLCQQLEKIEMEMNYFMKSIRQSISDSGKELSRVQTYSKRMTSDPEASSQLAIVDKIRKELATKSSTRQFNYSSLCVKLEKIKPPPTLLQVVKEETDKDDTNGLDDKDNFDFPPQSPSSPPPSSPESGSHCKMEKNEIHTQLSIQSTFRENGIEALPKTASKSENKSFPRKSLLYTKNLVTGIFNCNKCNKKSLHRSSIIRHYNSVHLHRRHKCDFCNCAVFTRRSYLKSHQETCRQKTLGRDPKFKFVCKECGKRFEKTKQLRDHRRKTHKNTDRYPCDLCDKKFKQSGHLKEHKDVIHFGKRYYCRFCGNNYSGKAKQRKHELSCSQKRRIKKESVEEEL